MGIVRSASAQKYEKYQYFLSENFQFLVVKFSIYLDRRVFVMRRYAAIGAALKRKEKLPLGANSFFFFFFFFFFHSSGIGVAHYAYYTCA